jgi:hypothetical protein
MLLASAVLMSGLGTGTAFAQVPFSGSPGAGDSGGVGARLREGDPRSYESMEAAQEPFELRRRAIARRPVPAASSEIAVGAEVRDREVAFLGTVESVNSSLAIVRYSGGERVPVPLSAFWKLDGHLLLGVTRAAFGRLAAAYAARAEHEATDDQAE